jgi:signal transduction histidine kinase
MDSIEKAFEIGAQEYITKPFNSAELLARVKTQIQLKIQKQQLKENNIILEQKVKERTKELQKANKMLEKLDKTKSDFLSIISHELRTPLNGIVGLTNLLGTTAMDSSQNEYIEHLKNVSQRLVRFSDMALLITSLKVNQYKPDFLAVSVNHLAKAAIKEFRKINDDVDLKVNLTTNENKPLILADSDLIKQVFILIIENALKYAGNTKPLDISIRVESQNVIIEFKDNGPGFSEEALSHVF